MGAQPICEACGQPVIQPSELPPLTPIQEKIFAIVRRRPGMFSAEQLRQLVWGGPDGGPESRQAIFVHISLLNNRLAPLKISVRSEAGKYVIRSMSDHTNSASVKVRTTSRRAAGSVA